MELKAKSRILLFADWYTPGYKAGGPIRSCVNFVSNMNQEYSLYIFTSDRDLGEARSYNGIEIDGWTDIEGGIKIFYASPKSLHFSNISQQIKYVNPDYIYLNSMFSRYFTIYPLLIKKLKRVECKIILSPRGMLRSSALQYKTFKKKIFLDFFKFLGFSKRIFFHSTDDTETQDIKKIFGKNVSITQLANFPSKQKGLIKKDKLIGEVNMVFIGRIHPIKNLHFLLECLNQQNTRITLTIVGSLEDETYWQKCEDLIRSLPKNVQVTLQKDVPHTQVETTIQQNHLFVLPTYGENFGHAIFEAFAAGRPVLISDQTPWRNLEEQHAGWDVPLNNPQQFIDIIERVAGMDDAEFQKWSTGAWEYAKCHSQNEQLRAQYRKLFS